MYLNLYQFSTKKRQEAYKKRTRAIRFQAVHIAELDLFNPPLRARITHVTQSDRLFLYKEYLWRLSH